MNPANVEELMQSAERITAARRQQLANPAQVHADMVRTSPILPDGRPYGCLEFGGDVHENALCRATLAATLKHCDKQSILTSHFKRERIIEIGSGGGRWTKVLHKAFQPWEVVCIDATDATADHIAAIRPELTPAPLIVICKDGALPSQPRRLLHDSASLVFSFDTFVHFPWLLFCNYLDAIPDAIHNGGLFVLHHATDDKKQPHQPTDLSGCWCPHAPRIIDERAAAHGLEVIDEIYATEGFGSRVVFYKKNSI
ncbi:MAG: class I SAM-dependent methyltransferase [Planctomycetaceae bacterium]